MQFCQVFTGFYNQTSSLHSWFHAVNFVHQQKQKHKREQHQERCFLPRSVSMLKGMGAWTRQKQKACQRVVNCHLLFAWEYNASCRSANNFLNTADVVIKFCSPQQCCHAKHKNVVFDGPRKWQIHDLRSIERNKCVCSPERCPVSQTLCRYLQVNSKKVLSCKILLNKVNFELSRQINTRDRSVISMVLSKNLGIRTIHIRMKRDTCMQRTVHIINGNAFSVHATDSSSSLLYNQRTQRRTVIAAANATRIFGPNRWSPVYPSLTAATPPCLSVAGG